MENLIAQLGEIFEKVLKLKTKYLLLKSEKQNLEVQLNHLKVEVDQYKSEIVKIKKEQEGRVAEDIKTTLSTSEDSNLEPIFSKQEQLKSANIEQVKLQLDDFLEDIDQCIQVIQNK
ncbi:MAG: hypothetical protein IPN86_14170 [Saprospiraceae bacterium]|nr:hypothetical protein [Saprospiraceae bacterium]